MLLHIGAGGLASGEADDPMFPPRRSPTRPRCTRCSPTAGGRGAVRALLHRGRPPRGRGVPHVSGDGRRVRAVPTPALRRDRVRRRRGSARSPSASTVTPSSCRKIGAALPAAPERVHAPQRARHAAVDRTRRRARWSGTDCASRYMFSTDYPHIEGGRHPVASFREMAERVDGTLRGGVLRHQRRTAARLRRRGGLLADEVNVNRPCRPTPRARA